MRAVVRGAGSIGTRHARALAAVGLDVALWPVRHGQDRPADGAPAGVRLVDDAAGYGLCSGADLVVIATDTSRHVADAVAALDDGAHRVLVEKPLSTTAATAAALLAHPRSDAVGVAAPLRAHHGFRAVREAVARLDGPQSAAVRCGSWLPDWRPGRDYRQSYSARTDEGGVLRDLVHEIDYATALFGPPALAGAVLSYDGPLDIAAEQAAALLWTAGRATVQLQLDYLSRPAVRGIAVHSPTGSVSWDLLAATVTAVTSDGETRTSTYPHDLDRDAVLADQATAFLAGVDDAPAPATLRDGLLAVDLCDRARRLAARTGATAGSTP